MSKKTKDHIAYTEDLVKSVLLDVEITVLCGVKKKFTREELDTLEYRDTCKRCIARAAEISGGGPIVLQVKAGWTDLLERSWMELFGKRDRNPFSVYSFKYSDQEWKK